MIPWLAAVALAQQLTLDVRPGGSTSATVDLGTVTTQIGQPAVGRRVRTEGGAHFVLDVRVAVRQREQQLQARPGRTFRRQRTVSPRVLEGIEVDILVSAQTAGTDLDVRLGRGRRTAWSKGPRAGVPVATDTLVATVLPGSRHTHEISLFVPDSAWGSQAATLTYTAVPR